MICDSTLSRTMGVERVVYGEELMMPAGVRKESPAGSSAAGAHGGVHGGAQGIDGAPPPPPPAAANQAALGAVKIVFAPLLAGSIESVVANRAEVQRYYG